MSLILAPADWLGLFGHFAMLSLLAVGGGIATVPDMHRYLVTERAWLLDSEFTACVALAQASPGPNVLFVALMGWNVGLHAGGPATAALGMACTLGGMLLPSTVLTLTATRWGQRNRERREVRAFKQGMAPLVVALLIATGWLLGSARGDPVRDWKLWLLTAAAAWVVWRTRIHLLWLLATGAALGAGGWV
jgi:chromate transporter